MIGSLEHRWPRHEADRRDDTKKWHAIVRRLKKEVAPVVRGKILTLREKDYAVAARLMGAGHGRILFRYLVPEFTSHNIVTLTISIPGMILGETSLSFLGLGLRPPIVSWGFMLQDCMNLQVVANYPWILLPVNLIIVTVLAFNFLGDGLRDAADPYSN